MWIVLTLLFGIIPLVYFYLTKNHNYWKKRGVPFIQPVPIFGNIFDLLTLKKAPAIFFGDIYNSPEAANQRFVGWFGLNSKPALFVKDPELLKQIYVKDFAHFQNRCVECDPIRDPLGHHNLFSMQGEEWKYLRTKLSPAFTSGKMKLMFKLIQNIAQELINHVDNHLETDEEVIEVRELSAKYTTDVISTCAFGIQSNSLRDPNAHFREFGRGIFEMPTLRALEIRSLFFLHPICRIMQSKMFPKDSADFFRSAFSTALNTRISEGIVRNDFMDTLIQLKNETTKNDSTKTAPFEFDGDFLISQSVLFFAAGFETTANTLGNTLLELAYAPEIQEKLRDEIQDTIEANNGDLPYESLFEMKYLDKVVSEAVRKYPPMPFLDRVCTKDYTIPGTDVVIEKGTDVLTALYNGLHYDPEYFPDPQRFDPERFNEENKASRHPFTYLPFGEGPHICIGMRFAHMNIKTGLSRLLNKYRVEPTEGAKLPLDIDQRATFLVAKEKIPLKFVPASR